PPVGAGEISPLALKRATQRTALAMLTPKRLAAALRDMPPSTTAPTTRSRRSSESAIPAASFPRRLSSSRSKPIRESLPRFNSLGDRSSSPLTKSGSSDSLRLRRFGRVIGDGDGAVGGGSGRLDGDVGGDASLAGTRV